MKKILLLLVLSAGMCSLHAQTDFKSKFIAVYGESNWDDWEVTNPALLHYLEQYAERGVSLQPFNAKYADAPMLEPVPLTGHPETQIAVSDFLADLASPEFNLLEYSFQVTNEIQVFRIPAADQVLVIASRAQIQSN
jgi:hypothetical protein